MSNMLIAFLAAISLGAWIYARVMRSSGNNSQNALTAAGVTAVVTFLAILIILGIIF